MSENQTNAALRQEEGLNIRDLVSLYLFKWRWFLLSLAVCMGAAVAYLLGTPPVYTRTATLLIEDNDKGGSISASDLGFADMGLFQSNTNVNNEIIAISSPALMQEVVSRLHLTVNYVTEGRFHDVALYGTALPVTVTFSDVPDSRSAEMTLTLNDDGTVAMSEFGTVLDGEKIKYKETVVGAMSVPLATPLGSVTVTPTAFFQAGEKLVIHVTKGSLYGTTTSYASKLKVALMQKEATVISLSIEDVSVERANDVLNTIISAYNESWVRARNQIAVSTSAFINERLRVIEQELGTVEEDISSYKSRNLISDLQGASNMYLEQSSELNARIIGVNNSLYMARYIRDYLVNDANRYQLLPAGAGIESSGIENQISEYNNILLQRNNLVANSSESNPLVADLDKSLDAMREAVTTSLDNHIVMLQTQLTAFEGQEQQATSRIAATPDQAKYLLSVERQQKVKESLYLFLLQKREENELSQAFTAYNTRVITPPSGGIAPTSPAKMQIMLVAFVLGLVIPMGVFFLIETGNTRVRGRKDLESLSLPYVGEIPMYDGKRRRLSVRLPDLRKKGNDRDSLPVVLVKAGQRNVINEAFRVVRTNLEFMASGTPGANVYICTSFNPGSGKTFVTLNLAASLAIKGLKVLVIDGDIRRGSISRAAAASTRPGLSDWLGGKVKDHVIVRSQVSDNIDILPCGTIPPNPTELLMEARLGQLVASVKKSYDYVLIDCPPVNIVADTQIISRVADRTIFVVRAGLLERGMLSELDNDFKESRFPGMCVLLNGTVSKGGYGYRYGYQYGYNYGYGYYGNE